MYTLQLQCIHQSELYFKSHQLWCFPHNIDVAISGGGKYLHCVGKVPLAYLIEEFSNFLELGILT